VRTRIGRRPPLRSGATSDFRRRRGTLAGQAGAESPGWWIGGMVIYRKVYRLFTELTGDLGTPDIFLEFD